MNSRYRRRYALPKTPYRRVLEHPSVSIGAKKKLYNLHKTLDPIELQMQVERKVRAIDKKFKALKRSRFNRSAA